MKSISRSSPALSRNRTTPVSECGRPARRSGPSRPAGQQRGAPPERCPRNRCPCSSAAGTRASDPQRRESEPSTRPPVRPPAPRSAQPLGDRAARGLDRPPPSTAASRPPQLQPNDRDAPRSTRVRGARRANTSFSSRRCAPVFSPDASALASSARDRCFSAARATWSSRVSCPRVILGHAIGGGSADHQDQATGDDGRCQDADP
jgi:hypothetical protein